MGDLQDQVSWFQSNSDLLKIKLKKCFDQNLCPDNEENIKMCQQLTKASEISHLLNNHAKKCKYLCLQQSENDAEEDKIDEHNRTFKNLRFECNRCHAHF